MYIYTYVKFNFVFNNILLIDLNNEFEIPTLNKDIILHDEIQFK